MVKVSIAILYVLEYLALTNCMKIDICWHQLLLLYVFTHGNLRKGSQENITALYIPYKRNFERIGNVQVVIFAVLLGK